MSRSNTVLLAAVIGLAVLYPVERSSHAQTNAEHGDTEPKQDAKPIDLSPIADEIKGLTRAVESIKSESKSSDEIEREKSDLQAQQDMAKWARLMYVVTALTSALTAIGVILLGFTLHFTKRAAIASDQMVEQSIIASKAAVDAAKATQVSVEAATRSVEIERGIMFAEPTWRWEDNIESGKPTVCYANCRFKNYGRSPIVLRDVERSIGIFPHPVAPDHSDPMKRVEFFYGKVLSPGETVDLESEIVRPLSQEEDRAVCTGDSNIWFYGILVYEDVFGNIRRTKFRWTFDLMAGALMPYGGKDYNERT